MNERIRELEAQCWEERKYGPAWFNSEKFAELIVRECAGIAKIKVFGLSTFENAEFVDESIKQHFGVEE